jgi:glycosyltransferase involved in cell wall biosynthesis
VQRGTPMVSVLLPVFNAERYLHCAISSILTQTFADFELLVLDDGSTDGSLEIASAFTDRRISILPGHRNEGLAVTLNRGLAAARGRLIARQDADDVSHPQRLARQVSFLKANPQVILLGTQARVVDAQNRIIGCLRRPVTLTAIRWMALFLNPIVHTSVMIRAEAVRELGGYSADYALTEDFHLWSRLLERGAVVANLPEPLVDYRHHAGSITASRDSDAFVRRSRSLESHKALHRQNLARVVTDEKLIERWVDLWFRARVPWVAGETESAGEAFSILSRIRREFLSREPAASRNPEMSSVDAAIYEVLAYAFSPAHPWSALRAFALLASSSMSTAAAFLPRFLAKMLLPPEQFKVVRNWIRR